MLTLGIETSCDETSCAILKDRDTLLSNVISSSLFKHQPFGGVVPEIASRYCLEQIDFVLKSALEQAKVKLNQIDLIAVTEGPGLIGSLLVGISFAKALSYQMKKPIIGVNHLDAHLTANFIGVPEPAKYIGLLVSGGHTMISYHEKGKVKLLGETVDDAVGEAYDKAAKLLDLGFPGGPIMDKLAALGNPEAFSFTKPKQDGKFDFSFSGIKTAVLYLVQKKRQETGDPGGGTGRNGDREKNKANVNSLLRPISASPCRETSLAPEFVRDIAASFQNAVVSWLVEKTLDAAESKKVKHVVVGGGVSANSELRKRLTQEGQERGIDVRFPPFLLTMDNAGMIARRGFELYKKGRRSTLKMSGEASLRMGATV